MINLYDLKQILAQSHHPSAPQQYGEVSHLIDHLVKCEGDPERVELVDEYALFTLLNETTYNIFGKLRRQNEHSLDRFIEQVRFYESDCLTDAQIKNAYYAIADLWEDNERDECHLADGTYISQDHKLVRELYSILRDLHGGDDDHLDELMLSLLTGGCYNRLKIITEDYYDKH